MSEPPFVSSNNALPNETTRENDMRTLHGNLTRFTSFALLASAGTIAGSAHGQQDVFAQTPTQSVSITSPTLQQCSLASEGFAPGTPQNVEMMNLLPASCSSVLAAELQKRAAATPSKVRKMYRADPAPWPANLASTTPANLHEGIFDAFVESDVRLQNNTEATYSGILLAGSTNPGASLIKTMTPQQAIAHRAHAEWEARGKNIADANNPCGEWVWKGFYDYSRFEDAAKACGSNDECVYQVAYASSAPGIAFRTALKGYDSTGKYFEKNGYSIPLVRGFHIKNPFFGAASAFLTDQQQGLLEDYQQYQLQKMALEGRSGYVELQAGPKSYSCAGNFRFRDPSSKYFVDTQDDAASAKLFSLDQKMNSVRQLLNKKAGYLIAPNGIDRYLHRNAEVFASEWHYHQAMHDRQKPLDGVKGQPLTPAERRAIDERTNTLVDLMEKYVILTSAKAHGKGAPVVGGGLQNPIDELISSIVNPVPDKAGGGTIGDPFIRHAVVSTMRGDLVEPSRAMMLESMGNVVTNQVAAPFALHQPAQKPMSLGAPMNDYVTTSTQSTLVGVERDYQKTTDVVHASVVDEGPKCPAPAAEGPSTMDAYELARAAQKVQEQIVELLLDEHDRGEHGCLSENGYNCDWSPTLFAQRFMGKFSEQREEAFQYCVLMTGGNTLDHEDPLFQVPSTKRAMSTFPDQLAFVESELRAQLDGLPYLKVGQTDHRIGEKTAGGKSFGDASWFGAGYDYSTDWSIVPEFRENAGAKETACAFRGTANAEFNARASVLGKEISIVKANAHGTARANGSGYNLDVEFLGQAFHATGSAEHFHHVESSTLETNRTSATVVVVVVPVTFQAYGELQYGYELEAKMEGNNQCGSQNPSPQLELVMQVAPFAKVNAVASAAVGVSGAQAGVRGRIALLETRLPVKASMLVKAETGAIKLFPSASADFEVGALSGSMSAFAEVGYGFAAYTAEKEIFSWRGVRENTPLWLLESDPVYLAAFNSAAWLYWTKENDKHTP